MDSHARIFDVEGYGQTLVFLDVDDDGGLQTKIRVWLGETGPAEIVLRLASGASGSAAVIWDNPQEKAIAELTANRLGAVLAMAGIPRG